MKIGRTTKSIFHLTFLFYSGSTWDRGLAVNKLTSSWDTSICKPSRYSRYPTATALIKVSIDSITWKERSNRISRACLSSLIAGVMNRLRLLGILETTMHTHVADVFFVQSHREGYQRDPVGCGCSRDGRWDKLDPMGLSLASLEGRGPIFSHCWKPQSTQTIYWQVRPATCQLQHTTYHCCKWWSLVVVCNLW